MNIWIIIQYRRRRKTKNTLSLRPNRKIFTFMMTRKKYCIHFSPLFLITANGKSAAICAHIRKKTALPMAISRAP